MDRPLYRKKYQNSRLCKDPLELDVLVRRMLGAFVLTYRNFSLSSVVKTLAGGDEIALEVKILQEEVFTSEIILGTVLVCRLKYKI